jgi:regulatory protein
MFTDPQREKAQQKAYRLLALRAHSEKELRMKLRKGDFTESVVNSVVEKCQELGYLNDANYARHRTRVLAVNRLEGDRMISCDLRDRGISEEECREAISEVRGEISEEEAIHRLLQKKARGMAVTEMDNRQKAKLARGLMGKGFPAGLVFRALKGTGEEGLHDDDGE